DRRALVLARSRRASQAGAPVRAPHAPRAYRGHRRRSRVRDPGKVVRQRSLAMIDQLRPDGTLRHLISLQGLDRSVLERLLERSEAYLRELHERPIRSTELKGITVANLFGEPSTRTRVSFELAARR